MNPHPNDPVYCIPIDLIFTILTKDLTYDKTKTSSLNFLKVTEVYKP